MIKMPTASRRSKLEGIKSKPPVGKKKIWNIWYDHKTGELVFDIEE